MKRMRGVRGRPVSTISIGLAGNIAPTANFVADDTTPAETTVVFTDLSTNSPTSWLWEKHDGESWANFTDTPTVQNPTETFDTGRTYSIRLTVTNGLGSDTETKTDYIEVA